MRILWIPHTGWHIPQRAHLFCHGLAEQHEVHATDWVADFASARDYLSWRYVRNFTYRRYRDGNVTVHGIPRVSPALHSRALRRLNTAVFTAIVARIIEQHAIDVVVGTFVLPPPQAPRLVFDLFDDNVSYWRSFGRAARYADEIAQTESAYLQEADAIVAVSSVLVDRAHELGARSAVHHIPNGIDLERFASADGAQVRARWGIRGRLVGAVGNHDKPAEMEKILAAARALMGQEVTFLIAGRGAAVPAASQRARREGLHNVVFHGYVPPSEAAETVAALDVGLCPYRKTPGADAGSPMRLLMYAAAGVPAVCTDLEEVRRMGFPNVVLVEDNAHALADGIQLALRLERAQPPQIAAYDIRRLIRQYESVLQA